MEEMENKELHESFLSELSDLLKKYNATIETEFRTRGWEGHDVWTVDFQGIYEGENQRPYSQLDLPTYLD